LVAFFLIDVSCICFDARFFQMPSGFVKWFNVAKGYGFISPTGGGADVFVHVTAVRRAGRTDLGEGEEIEYEIVTHRGRACADHLLFPTTEYDTSVGNEDDWNDLEDEGGAEAGTWSADRREPARSRAVQVISPREAERLREEQREQERRRAEERKLIAARMKRFFTDLSMRLNKVRPLIYQTKGVVFRKHLHSMEDLLNHDVFFKIDAAFGTIEDNMRSWQRHGSLDYELLGLYEDEKRRIVDLVGELTHEIATRKPTHWEMIRDALGKLVAKLLLRIGASKLLRIGAGSP
jgi:CspA family cold shock protein